MLPKNSGKIANWRNEEIQLLLVIAFFWGLEGFWDHAAASSGKFPACLPEQPCWLYALIALVQQHSPLPRWFYPTENWLISRCLTFSDRTRTGSSILTSAADPLLFGFVLGIYNQSSKKKIIINFIID